MDDYYWIFALEDTGVTVNYDSLLRHLYGDYRCLPSQEERTCKQHCILLDLHRSWESYEGYRDGMTFEDQARSIR